MILIGKKKKNRTVVEALLLEDGFGEETLKNKDALESIEGRLASYVA